MKYISVLQQINNHHLVYTEGVKVSCVLYCVACHSNNKKISRMKTIFFLKYLLWLWLRHYVKYTLFYTLYKVIESKSDTFLELSSCLFSVVHSIKHRMKEYRITLLVIIVAKSVFIVHK